MPRLAALTAILPPLASALACSAVALAPERFPEDSGRWVVSLHFAQLPLGLVALVYAETVNSGLSTGKRLALFFVCLAILVASGLVIVDDPLILSALGWAVVGYVLGLLLPGPDPAAEAARVGALAQDTWELWALVSGAGVIVAAIVAFAVRDAQPAWANLIPASYFFLMVAATLNTYTDAFARHPAALSDSAFVRAVWAAFPGSGSGKH